MTAARLPVVSALLALWFVAAASAVAQPAGRPVRAKITKTAVSVTALHPGQKATAAVVLEIEEKYHAQSRAPLQDNLIKFQVKLDKTPGVTFGEPVYPPGEIEEYPALGKLSVYTGRVVLFVPFEVAADAKPGPLKISGSLVYQLCDDKSCFPPERPKFAIETKVVPAGEASEPNEPDLFAEMEKQASAAPAPPPLTRGGDGGGTPGIAPPTDPMPTTAATAPDTTPGSAADVSAAPVSAAAAAGAPPVTVADGRPGWGIPAALSAAFVAGILFNIVPCVLPVLPIKVLGFAEVAQHDRTKTLLLSSVFGLGIVTVFAVLAVLILVLQTITWGQQFSNPIFAWGIVILLLVLSMWMFGLLDINLPPGAYAFAPRHDTFVGNYLWGILTAVLSTPCTGPLFPPLMLWAQGQPTYVGVPAMMMVGVGMAFPYVVLSAFPEAARRFPRVGPWSELFKQMLGFILLGFTFFFAAGRFTTPQGQWWAAVPVAVMAAIYLMARTVQLTKEARPVAISTVISVGIITASVLVALRFSGTFDGGGGTAGAGGASASAVNWTPYSDDALAAARKAGKLVLVKFTANWCLNCQYVEATVYHDDAAIAALRSHDVVTLKADLTDDDAPGWNRLSELNATGGIPLTAIYAPGYDRPVQISSVYTTGTLVKTLDDLSRAEDRGAREPPPIARVLFNHTDAGTAWLTVSGATPLASQPPPPAGAAGART